MIIFYSSVAFETSVTSVLMNTFLVETIFIQWNWKYHLVLKVRLLKLLHVLALMLISFLLFSLTEIGVEYFPVMYVQRYVKHLL